MLSKTQRINEKTNSIPITVTKCETKEYSLKQNLFDPSKSSPPNKFIIKLQNRMTNYNSTKTGLYKNDDNRDNA